MSWSAESLVLVATGGMLALVVIASLHPRVALRGISQVVYSLGAVVFIVIGLLAAGDPGLTIPVVVFAMPAVPVLIAIAVVRRSRKGVIPPAAPDQTAIDPVVEEAPFGATGPGGARLLAASPYATPGELTELAYARPDLRAAIASNPAAPSSLLQWLVDQGEPAVLAAIAARRSATA